jgi:hypothetical protein
MPERNHPIRAQRSSVWICVLLAVLLLYNPFAALCYSHDTIEVHTLQRNRASLGASELQHFSPVQDGVQQADMDLESNREEVAVPAGSYVARGFEREVEVPQSDIVFKVWSRPPPLA